MSRSSPATSRLPCNVFLSVLMLHVSGLSHAVSLGLRAFPLFLGLSSVLAYFVSASVPSETALFFDLFGGESVLRRNPPK